MGTSLVTSWVAQLLIYLLAKCLFSFASLHPFSDWVICCFIIDLCESLVYSKDLVYSGLESFVNIFPSL